MSTKCARCCNLYIHATLIGHRNSIISRVTLVTTIAKKWTSLPDACTGHTSHHTSQGCRERLWPRRCRLDQLSALVGGFPFFGLPKSPGSWWCRLMVSWRPSISPIWPEPFDKPDRCRPVRHSIVHGCQQEPEKIETDLLSVCIAGSGLEPLCGSALLEQINISLLKKHEEFYGPNAMSLSKDIVLPIITSISTMEGTNLSSKWDTTY